MYTCTYIRFLISIVQNYITGIAFLIVLLCECVIIFGHVTVILLVV